MDNYKRRQFIKLSALGFASIALQLNSMAAYAQRANGHLGKWHHDSPLNWDAFLTKLTKLAETQHQLPWDQKAYTDQVKRLLLQCDFPAFENVKREMDAYVDKRENWFESANLHHEVNFQVSLFQFEKGEYIPHHDHPDMTGIANVVSGSLVAKNYTIEEQLSETREVVQNGSTSIIKSCTLRETSNEIIKAGDVSVLTAHEGNIHSIMPHEFSQLVDVFTPAYQQDTNANWYNVNEEEFYQGQKKLFKAEYSQPKLEE